jgi:hypothetical protein
MGSMNTEHGWGDTGLKKGWEMKESTMHKHFERRIEKRHACSDFIFFATRSRLYEGRLKDYSRNGLFIKTKEALAIGDVVTVVDPNPEGTNQKRRGQILWRNREGIGVALRQIHSETEPKVIRLEHRGVQHRR